jgi:hypothetical protein
MATIRIEGLLTEDLIVSNGATKTWELITEIEGEEESGRVEKDNRILRNLGREAMARNGATEIVTTIAGKRYHHNRYTAFRARLV